MRKHWTSSIRKAAGRMSILVLTIVLGSTLVLAIMLLMGSSHAGVAYADPIDPPEGYPKLSLSVKTVTPTLAETGGAVLSYAIEIRNTGAYTATNVTLTDLIPEGTVYNHDAQATVPPLPEFANGTLRWEGEVGFDTTVVVSFSVSVSDTLIATVRNTAVISHPLISSAVTVTAETVVTDRPILTIEKTASPLKPGANGPLTYTIVVANQGQPAVDLPITVIDQVPSDTVLRSIGSDGSANPAGDVVTWERPITLNLDETAVFTFSVDVGDVPSGTVIANTHYSVDSGETDVTAGQPYTITIVDPEFLLSKQVWPDPPGSNREMTYTLSLLNAGSLATNLVITDRVPAGVVYRRGGSEAEGVVSWALASLDTGESVDLTFTVYVSDVMDIPIVNSDYGVCCREEVCKSGKVMTSVVQGPNLSVLAEVDPIAHKPGGGTGTEVTPFLVVHNLGPGNALDAQATLFFDRISVSAGDLYAIPSIGTPPPFPDGPDCGDKCVSYVWEGDLGYGETITFTTHEGQSTIGGEEGTPYSATVVIEDDLSNMTTSPITDTAIGLVTHYANVVPSKSAPPVVGRGQLLTYAISVYNRGLTTDQSPVLTDVVPMSTTFVSASDGGTTRIVSETVVVSWTLPNLGPGEGVVRSFSVLVDDDLISGTKIVNRDYGVAGYGNILIGARTSGPPVTTTVREVGLVDSYKEVTPALVLPGPGNVLTYYLHIVNSSPVALAGVAVYDLLPWQSSTYRRDAVASAGQVVSDIVSIRWTGDVAAMSSEVVTFTTVIDPDYQGPITNTATISHSGLLEAVVVEAVSYVSDRPILRISKSAAPGEVKRGEELAYTIQVVNLGQQATGLVITDVIPSNADYVDHSATGGAGLVDGELRWELPVLKPGEAQTYSFRVTARAGTTILNDQYAVTCSEGVADVGRPVVTPIAGGGIYLPLILRN